MHPLKEYCLRNKKTIAWVAQQAGTEPGYLSQIIMGIRRPSPDLALRIELATNSEIHRDQLLFPKLYDIVGN